MSEEVLFSRLLEGLIGDPRISTAKNYHPVSIFSVVSKVLEKLVNNGLVDHREKCGHFSADLLTILSHRIARAFNRSGAT